MKKRIFISLFALTSLYTANAQSYLGYVPDNYAGVQSVLYNPASIADSRFKADINLFSLSSAVGNDLYGVKIFDVFKNGYDFDMEAKKNFSNSNNAFTNLDAMGPSVMFNIAPKHTLAIFTRARAVVNVLDINGQVVNDITKDNKTSFPSANLGSPNAVANSWGEFGISYAAVLFQRGEHFLKGGITAKYLQGAANYHFQGTNVSVKYDDFGNPLLNTYTTTGNAIYGSSQDFATNSDVEFDSKSRGFGADLGLVYEWRPEYNADRADINDLKDVNKYKLRLGVSVTDLGYMKYDKGIRNSYDLTGSFSQSDFDGYDNFDDFMKSEFTPTTVNGTVKSNLPTAIHADIDWNINGRFYLNATGDLGMVTETKLNQNSIANRVSVTPRYESKWFSAYIPVSYMDYSEQTQVGLGLRTGVFFIGSSSIVSNAISKSSKSADIHLGIKIPIYQKKAEDVDQDGDGLLDKVDDCPTVAGPVENRGCPWGDKDNDGILDKDDKCPDVAGPAANNGCPWEDKDFDGVLDKDDKCPEVAGPKENAGCPWLDTDEDGILDKDDRCPLLKGTLANKGCPEVTKEIVKKLNDYSKSVLFDSSKATIKPESNASLDEIVRVMNEYYNTKFKLEGHTDSTGNVNKNLQLSKDRAAAVKIYLISKGISPDRISSEGYGVTKPITSNKSAEGRAQNRRVEINVIVN